MILTGENYSEWSSELENALRAKRKFRFINGSLKIPDEKENPVEIEMWRTTNSMIVGWIRASISPTIRSTMPFSPDACKMWNELKKRLSVGSGVRVHQLKTEMAACKQEGSSVIEYFGRLSIKQDTVSHSSAEAEYHAMSDALKELKWMKRLLEDLGVKHETQMELFCDSKAAIYIAANPVFHERTKTHIYRSCSD